MLFNVISIKPTKFKNSSGVRPSIVLEDGKYKAKYPKLEKENEPR